MRKGKLYISILLGLCLCLFTAFGVACKDENSTGNSSTGGDSSTEEPATPTLESISVSGETEVFIDEFDYADYTITATYSDNSTKTATLTADNLSADDNAKLSTVGTHALTVSYESVTCSWTITLKNHDFAGITFDDITTTYDGTAKTLAVAGLPTGAQVSYDKATSYTNAGEYTVKATITLANYNPVELTATLTINKATYDMSTVVFEDKTVTYNGQAHSIEATNLPNGVTAQYTGNNQINANEYTVTASFTGDSQNYEPIANKTATLTINKATYDMSGVVFKDKSVNYTGEAYSIEATNLPEGVSATYDGNNQTQAGEYTITAHFTGDRANYNAIPDMTATLKINASDLTGISFHDGEFTYDGTKKSIFITGKLPEGVTVDYTNNEQINANSYTVTATFTCTNGNYTNLPELTATLTIKKATYDMSAVVFEDKTVTYDGQAHSNLATNLPNGVTAEYTGNKQINANEYEITAMFKGDSANYEPIASKTATLTIEQRELTLAFNGETTLKYNGKAQKTITVQATNLVNGDSVELTINYNGEMIEAGEYIATATLTAHQNYKLTANNTVKVTITRATHTVTFKQDDFAEVTREVLDLADLTDIPTPQHVDGYTFTWNRTDFTSITEDITVTANKTVITYTIEYVLQYGKNPTENPKTYTIESASITLKNPENLFGLQFGGWYTSETFLPSTSVTKVGGGQFGDIKLYGQFIGYRVEEAIGFEIDYSQGTPTISKIVPYAMVEMDLRDSITISNGCTWQVAGDELGTVIYSRKIIPLTTGENVFYLSVFHPDGNHDTLYELHIYRLDMKTYTFMNGTEVHLTGEIEELSVLVQPENPTCGGYRFDGWQINGEGALVSFPYTVMQDIVFTAKYTPIVYSAKFYPNSGTLDENTQSYTAETGLSFEIPTRDYYDFVGWYEVATDKPFDSIAIGVYGDKEFYAKWTPTVYAITYELNGGNWTANNQNPTTYTIETADILFGAEIKRAGYTFDGWYTDESLKTVATGIACGSHGDKTFYAKWNANLNTLKFDGNGATSGEMQEMQVYTDETVLIENQYERKGYLFIGWSTVIDGNVEYKNGVACTMGTDSEYTLYAVWDRIFTVDGNTITGLTTAGATLSELVIPDNIDGVEITTIADGAFRNCSDLKEITLPFVGANKDGTGDIYETVFGYIFGYTISSNSTISGATLQYGYTQYPGGISTNYHYFIPTSLKKVTIKGGTIGDNAFYNCSSLTSVEIPDGVTSIGFSAFYKCSGLIEIVIPDSVTSIGSSAFYKCSGLIEIVIPDSVTSIGGGAFSGCSSLKYNQQGNLIYLGNINNPYLYLETTISDKITSAVIDENCKIIGGAAFAYCSNLTSVVIPDSVTSIGSSAFYDCSSLTSVVIGDSVTSIGSSAFYGCSSLTKATMPTIAIGYIPTTNLQTVILTSGDSIASSAFYNCSSLTSIEIPDSVTSIGYNAFYNCYSLTSIEIPDSVTSIGSSAFSGCSSLTSIEIPNGVTSIDSYSFYNCDSLTSVVIGNSVTSIGDDAFYNCDSLTSVVIGNSVTSIGDYAFYSCSSLTSIEIPDSVTSIGSSAFAYCSSLTSIKYCGTQTQWNAISKGYHWNYNTGSYTITYNYQG